MKSLVMCPLVSRDMRRATRAVRACLGQLHLNHNRLSVVPVVNSRSEAFVGEFTEWCGIMGIPCHVSQSNGTPSKGKNEVLSFFLRSGHDGLVMLDGDDLLYPTAARQVERHIMQHGGTDLLIVKPSDQVVSHADSGGMEFKDGMYALCWGTNEVKMGYPYGTKAHNIFTEGQAASRNNGGHVYYSRRLAESVRYDEGQLLGEDLLFEFEALRLHQAGKISFWLSFASDVQLLDRTSENEGIQSHNNHDAGTKNFQRLKLKVESMMEVGRSGFEELPVGFPEMLFDHPSKIAFIKENF